MVIFVNDIPLKMYLSGQEPSRDRFNHVMDAAAKEVVPSGLNNHVLILNVEEMHLDEILAYLQSPVPTGLQSITLVPRDYASLKKYLKAKYSIVKAAGGLVRKKEKFLMIYRMKKWDLPKGKKEKKEKYRQTAVREVGEECNVTVKIGKKICTTWHTYTMNRNNMLKQTRWYVMDVTDDSAMKASAEEDIEDIRWMSAKEVYHALEHSYKSIAYVFERYYAMVAKDNGKGEH